MPVVRGKGIISKYLVSNKPPIIIKEALREKVVILNSVPKEIKKDVMGIRYTGTLNNQEDCMYILKTLITIQRSNIITSYYQIHTCQPPEI